MDGEKIGFDVYRLASDEDIIEQTGDDEVCIVVFNRAGAPSKQ